MHLKPSLRKRHHPNKKTKKLRRVKDRAATPRPRSEYYKENMSDKDSEKETKKTRKVTSITEEEKVTAQEISDIRETLRGGKGTKCVRKVSNTNKDINMVNKVEEETSMEESGMKKINRQNSNEYNIRFRESFKDRGTNFDISATTDTGAQQTVCGAERAKKMGITLFPNINNILLVDASGNSMPVIGVTHLYAIPEGARIPKFVEMAVTTSMTMDVLISLEDQKRLALLNPKYPEYNRQWDSDEMEPANIRSVQTDSDYETEAEDEEEDMEKPPDNPQSDLQFNPNLH